MPIHAWRRRLAAVVLVVLAALSPRPLGALPPADSPPASAVGAEGTPMDLRLLATTDLHMTLADYDYYADRPDPGVGLVRVASLIRAARAGARNSLLVDAGDLIQGTPMGVWAAKAVADALAQGRPAPPHPAIQALNALGYDAAVMGNHEFNFGLDVAMAVEAQAHYPVLAGNVVRITGGRPLLPAHTLLTRTLTDEQGAAHTVRIGVVGVLTPQIMVWDRDALTGKVTTTDMVATAAESVRALKGQGADLVLVLAHTGLSPERSPAMAENVGADLAALPGVDAVVVGHAHRVFPGPDYGGPDYKDMPDTDLERGLLHGKPVVMAGAYGSHLGVIDLRLAQVGGAWRVADAHAYAQPIAQRRDGKPVPLVDADAALAAVIAPAHQATLDYVRQPVGETRTRLDSFLAYAANPPTLALVARVQRDAVVAALAGTPDAALPVLSAVAPFKAGGQPGPGNYTDIAAGRLTLRNVADLYLYPNTLAAVKVDGATLKNWLEMSARAYARIDPTVTTPQMLVSPQAMSFNFDVIDGLSWVVDLTQPARFDGAGRLADAAAHRIRDLRHEGRPVADDDRFIVATNNYRANGGGGFPGLDGRSVVYAGTDTVQDLIARHIAAHSPIALPASQSTPWRFAPLPAGVTVLLATSPKAVDALADHPGITDAGAGADGFHLLRLDLSAGSPLTAATGSATGGVRP